MINAIVLSIRAQATLTFAYQSIEWSDKTCSFTSKKSEIRKLMKYSIKKFMMAFSAFTYKTNFIIQISLVEKCVRFDQLRTKLLVVLYNCRMSIE
jgi:hypothetical protein